MTEYRHQISDEESSRIQRFLRLLAVGTAIFGLLVLVAFLSADRWLLLISHEGERKFVDRYVLLVKESLLHSSEPVLQDYVEQLTRQIAGGMNVPDDLRIRIHVVKGRVVNASATAKAAANRNCPVNTQNTAASNSNTSIAACTQRSR